jgi:thymidylate kinase
VDDPHACVERVRKSRGRTSMFEEEAYLSKVQEIYKRLATRHPARFKVLEGGDLEGLIERAQKELELFLPSRGVPRAAKKAPA